MPVEHAASGDSNLVWFLLSSRLRQWLFMTVALPLLGRLLVGVGRRLEAARGPSQVSTSLQRSGMFLNQRARGQMQSGRRGARAAGYSRRRGRR